MTMRYLATGLVLVTLLLSLPALSVEVLQLCRPAVIGWLDAPGFWCKLS